MSANSRVRCGDFNKLVFNRRRSAFISLHTLNSYILDRHTLSCARKHRRRTYKILSQSQILIIYMHAPKVDGYHCSKAELFSVCKTNTNQLDFLVE